MGAGWATARIGDIAPLVRRPVEAHADQTYREIGIRSFGKGVFHKTPTTGLEIGSKRVFAVEPGDLLFNIVFAWEGAVAVATEAERGMIGSHRFLTCVTDKKRADARYLNYWFRRREGRDQLLWASPGGAGRNRTLGIDKLSALEVPLPPLDEQRRIVARIDALAAKIAEARGLREEAGNDAGATVLSILHDLFVNRALDWSPMPMTEAIEVADRQVDPKLPEFAGLPHISGENIESKTCRLLPWRTAAEDGVRSNNYLFSPGTVLYSKIRPYLRKATYVDFAGVCSAEVYPIRIISPMIDPHFLKWTLVAEPFTAYANRLSGRTRMPKLNRKQLFGFVMHHPPIGEQRRIVAELDALQAKVDAVKRLQAETATELDALLPAILDRAFKGEL